MAEAIRALNETPDGWQAIAALGVFAIIAVAACFIVYTIYRR